MDAVTNAAQQQNIPLFVIDELILNYIYNGSQNTNIKKNVKKKKKLKFLSKNSDGLLYKRSSLVDSSCKVFCNSLSKVTHLATLSDFVSHETLIQFGSYLNKLYGLTVISLSDTDPTLEHLNLHVTIPTHVIIVDEDIDIRKDSHVVHISILHDRIRGNYWWQALLKLTEHQERILHRQGLKRIEFRLPYSSAIFPK